MTDAFTHSYSLQLLYPILKQSLETINKIKIADFVTGSGYIAFALYDLISELIKEKKPKSNDLDIDILGYDIYDDFIERNKKIINSKFSDYPKNIKIDFITKNLDETDLDEKDFNIIYIGFAITKEKLITYSNFLANDGTILAPILNPNSLEQDLSLIRKENGQIVADKIMKCMFSDMLNEQNKNDYQFFGGEEENENSLKTEAEQVNLYDNENENLLAKKITDFKAELEIYESELKQTLNQSKGLGGKIPPLDELNKIPNFSKLLNLINSRKKKIKVLMEANKKILN